MAAPQRVPKLSKARQLVQQLHETSKYIKPIPYEQRKQVFLPEHVITLVRTPWLPPRFASFWVPLTFNKLDLKDYLKRVYDVDVLNIRSYVQQQIPTRILRNGKAYGPWRRPQSLKRMTVELKDPFVWPAEPEDFTPWEKETFYGAKERQDKSQEAQKPDAILAEPKEKRESLEAQIKALKETVANEGVVAEGEGEGEGEGKTAAAVPIVPEWTPTWKALGLNFDRPVLGRKITSSPQPPQPPPLSTSTSQQSEEASKGR
ncbi:hypothetical protein AJ80_01365 [Polytolypa hystricis UAMH7299]|uniref:Large ribosomal subunit protein uL23m n=1 Tax=Polytolypa hystricis (strain UAMH7299) TaxID=1447883 RepID=A0A2B7Z0Y2_POLH7|nr:hypothetical protein AJ80_01365 [Polytolypa hystricis UAMH7299]